MILFGDMPLPLQNFLSDLAEDIVQVNADKSWAKSDIIETLCPIFEDLALSVSRTLDFIKSPGDSGDGPFHMVIGPQGLQIRSTRNRHRFSEYSLFDFMWGLLRLTELEHTVYQVLKVKYGDVAIGVRPFDSLIEELLQTLSTQYSLSCVFHVPHGSDTPHENSATFMIIEGNLKAVCDSVVTHAVHIEE